MWWITRNNVTVRATMKFHGQCPRPCTKYSWKQKKECPASKARNLHPAFLKGSDCTLALMSAYELNN